MQKIVIVNQQTLSNSRLPCIERYYFGSSRQKIIYTTCIFFIIIVIIAIGNVVINIIIINIKSDFTFCH